MSNIPESRRDKLARVIDPAMWEMYDHPNMADKDQALRDVLVVESRNIADRIINSGLIVSEKWDSREFLKAKQCIIDRTSRRGYCYDVEDGLDGHFMHDLKCVHWPDGSISGSQCIRQKG